MKEEVNQIINYEEVIQLIYALSTIVRENKDENVVYLAQCKLWGVLQLIDVPGIPALEEKTAEVTGEPV